MSSPVLLSSPVCYWRPRGPGLEGQVMVDRERFFAAYQEGGSAPWDIGLPQPVVMELAEAGEFQGPVLDVGCGTGENALYLASLGFQVTGVDMVGEAVARARAKAQERDLRAEFHELDALHLGRLDKRFQTLLDCGLFHTFSDEHRLDYRDSLEQVTLPGTIFHLLCFSELEPGDQGPRRVTCQEIRACFEPLWRVVRIQGVRFASKVHDAEGARAWKATLEHS